MCKTENYEWPSTYERKVPFLSWWKSLSQPFKQKVIVCNKLYEILSVIFYIDLDSIYVDERNPDCVNAL